MGERTATIAISTRAPSVDRFISLHLRSTIDDQVVDQVREGLNYVRLGGIEPPIIRIKSPKLCR
jgi:hypothetical protein